MKAKTAPTRKQAEKEKALVAAVSWKLFQVQALLVGGRDEKDRVTEKVLDLGHKWLQPIHYEEVIKERAIDGRCGYPLCQETISAYNAVGSEKPVYRINLKDKSVESMTHMRYYCSSKSGDCMRRSAAYAAGLDAAHPVGRDIAATLDISQVPEGVEVVLDTIKFHDASDSDEEEENQREETSEGSAQVRSSARGPATRPAFPFSSSAASATSGQPQSVGVQQDQEKEEKESVESDDRPPPPSYTDARMFKGGGVQPKYWGIRGGDTDTLAAAVSQTSRASYAAQGTVRGLSGGDDYSARDDRPAYADQKSGVGGSGGGSGSGSGSVSAQVARTPTSIRATEMLELLRADPTKRGVGAPSSAAIQRSAVGTGMDASSGSSSSSNVASPKKSSGASLPDDKGGSVPSVSAVTPMPQQQQQQQQHPSFQPTFHNHNLDPALIKEVKPTAREEALRKVYKAGGGSGTMQMQMMGQGPLESKAVAKDREQKGAEAKGGAAGREATRARDKGGVPRPDEADAEAEAEGYADDDEHIAALNAADAAAEEAEYQARLDAGRGYSSWREDGQRLDTQAPAGPNAETVAAIIGATPASAQASGVQRVRMNPRGTRAKELAAAGARKAVSFDEPVYAPQAQRAPAVAPAKEAAVLGEDASAEERLFMAGINEEGNSPKPHYDNCIVPAKIREVEWHEPDPEYLKSRLKSVPQRVAPKPIDTQAQKTSLFKQQRLREKAQAKGLPSHADANLDRSVGAQTVGWEIKETDAPVTLPESAILTKHGDDYEFKSRKEKARDARRQSKDSGDNAFPEEGEGEGDDSLGMYNTHDEDFAEEEDEDDRLHREALLATEEKELKDREARLETNRQLRHAFFSSNGVSAMIIPEGFSTGKSGEPGSEDMKIEDIFADAEEAEEAEDGEEGGDEDAAGTDDSEQEYVLPPAKPSTFLQLWTALDDFFSFMGVVFRRRATSADAKDAKISVDMDYERNNSMSLASTGRLTLAGRQTVMSLLSRGIATSELALNMNDILPPTHLSEFYYTKKRILGMLDATRECPALTSTGWALLGLLLIDGIVRLRQLYERPGSSEADKASQLQNWHARMRKLVPLRAEGAPRVGVVGLDEHELRLLRGFFDEL